MAKSAQWAGGPPTFARYPVNNLYSVAHLFPKAARCGVYVLDFANGDRYVGQSVNVVTRYGQHRRTWADIRSLEFCATPRARLDEVELLMITSERSRDKRLRNIRHALGPVGESDLDPVVSPVEQSAWLNDGAEISEGGLRVEDSAQRAAHWTKYVELTHVSSFPLVALMLNHYVALAVPKPVETERTFWSLSAMPSTKRTRDSRRLATICINKMETLFIVEVADEEGTFVVAALNVSRRSLERTMGTLDQIRSKHPDLLFDETPYESAGGDCVSIRFSQFEVGQVFDNANIMQAARELNLMLMRKGPTFQWRWHNYGLADWVLGDIDDATLASLEAPSSVGGTSHSDSSEPRFRLT